MTASGGGADRLRPSDGDLGPAIRLLMRPGATVEVEVEGASMAPTIQAGGHARIHCGGSDGLAAGDVVAFLAGGRLLTIHRLVADHGDYVVTRGDANLFCDPPIPRGDVVGPVASVRSETDGAWAPAAPCPDRRGALAPIARASAALTIAALRVHVRLAQLVSLLSLLLALPRAVVLHGGLRPPPILAAFSLKRAAVEPGGRDGS